MSNARKTKEGVQGQILDVVYHRTCGHRLRLCNDEQE